MQPSPGGVLPPCQISNQLVEACLSSETNGQTSDTPKGRLVTHNPLKCEQFQLILCILSLILPLSIGGHISIAGH